LFGHSVLLFEHLGRMLGEGPRQC